MTKKLLKLTALLSSVFVLSACDWKLNFNLTNSDIFSSLDFIFGKEKDFQIVQLNSALIWGPYDGEKEYTYELFIDGESQGKMTSAYAYGHSQEHDDVGKKFQVYVYDGDTFVAKTKVYKYKDFENMYKEEDADIVYYAADTSNSNTVGYSTNNVDFNKTSVLENDKIINISKDVNCISIKNFESWNVQFNFEKRTKPIFIYLYNSKLSSVSNTDYSVFNYNSKNKPLFYFLSSASNVIDCGINKSGKYGATAISLPRVCFTGSGFLTLKGGKPGEYSYGKYNGYAIKANNIYNGFLDNNQLKLIGGSGMNGVDLTQRNGIDGQFPINEDAMIKSAIPYSIAIKAGDGGNGANNDSNNSYYSGDGGNTYSYSYLVNKVYSKYKFLFNDYLGEPSPGLAGTTKGKYQGTDGKLITEQNSD